MHRPAAAPRVLRWIRSFYLRIAISFIVFAIAVIVAQSVMFSYMMARRESQDRRPSPNSVGAVAASEIGSALASESELDLARHVESRYGRLPWGLFVVLKDGRVAGNGRGSMSPELLRSIRAVIEGAGLGGEGVVGGVRGPVVSAPIQVRGELRGLVVLPPPPPGGVLREVGRLLSLPGTLLLILGTGIAAFVIFAPARRRLHALEEAADRLARGDLGARAPEEGGDEIARVAHSFNRMASELAARDEALRTADRLRRQMLADVSHELKTPLTSMRGYIETLQMPELSSDAERRTRYFTTIERETRRLERIVSDLLDLARLESGAGPLDVRVFSIERLFQQVASRHEREAGERAVAVTLIASDTADQVTGDPHRLDQVIDNLVANALRHTPGGERHRDACHGRPRRGLPVGRELGRGHRARAPSARVRSLLQGGFVARRNCRQRPRPVDRQGDRGAARRDDRGDERARSYGLHRAPASTRHDRRVRLKPDTTYVDGGHSGAANL